MTKTGLMLREIDWGQILSTWFRYSSMHGMKHMTKDISYFLIQRVLWTIITFVAFILLLYQISTRLVLYYSYPVAVDMKFNYLEEAEFPAVTICNTNRYRSSKLSETGFYHFWNEFYDPSKQFTFADYKDEFKDVDVLDMIQYWSHQKEQLIFSCSWHGGHGNCGPKNFTTTFTDYGMCYTINANLIKPLIATLTGSSYGLKLILNVEQYEYSRGPENTAGVKVLVHPRDEPPRVKDLGVFIPVGFEALVGIQHTYRINLPEPYGNCSYRRLRYFDAYTPATCNLECIIDYVVKECGCRDFYMPQLYPGYPAMCDIQEWVLCAMGAEERFYASNTLCDCPEPCIAGLYKTSISYAAISKLNSEAMFNSNPKKMKDIRDRSNAARNIVAKEDKKQLKRDTKVLMHLLDEFLELEYDIQLILLGVEDMKAAAETAIEDVEEINGLYLQTLANFTIFFNENIMGLIIEPQIFIVESGVSSFISYFETPFQRNFELFWDIYERYFSTQNAEDKMNYMISAISAMDNMKVDVSKNIGSVKEAMYALEVIEEELYEKMKSTFPMLNKLKEFDKYNSIIKKEVFYVHDCLVEIASMVDHEAELIFAEKLFETSQPNQHIKEIYELLRQDGTGDIKECGSHIRKIRSIILNHYVPWLINTYKIEPYEKETAALKLKEVALLNPFKVESELQKVFTQALKNHVSVRSWIEDYFMWRKSKLDLAANMTSFEVSHLQQAMQLLMTSFAASMEKLAHSDEGFLEITHHIFSFIEKDEFVIEYSELDLEKKLDVKHLPSLLADIEHRMHDLKKKAREYQALLTRVIELTHASFSDVTNDLTKFFEGSQIDSRFQLDNFLRLNVYFQDFRQEQIKQNPGYPFSSFIADLGGSLGLFLGASIISMIEVFDLILETFFLRAFRPDLMPTKLSFKTAATITIRGIQQVRKHSMAISEHKDEDIPRPLSPDEKSSTPTTWA